MSILEPMGLAAKTAARKLALCHTAEKNHALESIAAEVERQRGDILRENQADVEAGRAAGLGPAMLDRLTLNEPRLDAILADLRGVAELPDPVGEVFDENILPNGLKVRKQRVPLGVLGIIYESRPNVTLDVVALALKSGNAAILRGGSETIRTNLAILGAVRAGLAQSAVSPDVIQFIENPDRALVLEFLRLNRYVDVIIPRGSAALHQFCRENSQIPVITGGIGICHLYVDQTADLDAAVEVIRNAKIQRPTVCNALDTAIINNRIAPRFLPRLVERLAADGVTFRADPRAMRILALDPSEAVFPANVDDFDKEWLGLVLGLKIVNSLEEAMEHIALHSTGHSDGILTGSEENAQRFMNEVDSAAVYVNASTRFTDGSQLGLGAEIAISTQRLHARGPMGLRELTTYKWVIRGDHHVRP